MSGVPVPPSPTISSNLSANAGKPGRLPGCGQGFSGMQQVMHGVPQGVAECAQGGPGLPQGVAGFAQGAPGLLPGSCRASPLQGQPDLQSNDSLLLVRNLLQSMSQRELQWVLQDVNQRVQTQGVFVPDRLGQIDQAVHRQHVPFVAQNSGVQLPGPFVETRPSSGSEDRDVFSKSEKWLMSPPKLTHQDWKSREDEVIGWSSFVQELHGPT